LISFHIYPLRQVLLLAFIVIIAFVLINVPYAHAKSPGGKSTYGSADVSGEEIDYRADE